MLKDQDGFPDKDLSCDLKQCKKDNCPQNTNADQADLDKDGKGDQCDLDADGDGILDISSRKKNDEEVCTVGRKKKVLRGWNMCKSGVDPCTCNYEDKSGCRQVTRVAACVRAKL